LANRRMFSKEIVDSDAFYNMPLSSQCLYFHLCLSADDDWFIWNNKKIIRIIWGKKSDYKKLVEKRFVLDFWNWICVIKHRKISNYIRKDRYNKTTYTKEMQKIRVKENGSYTEKTKPGQPVVNQKTTSGWRSIGKDSIVEKRKEYILDREATKKLLEEDEISKYINELFILHKMIDLWYKVEDKKSALLKNIERVTGMCWEYIWRRENWSLNWKLAKTYINQRYEYRSESKKKVTNYKSSVRNSFSMYSKPRWK